MISQVSIKNFKCLLDLSVQLEPFTVFVGANGSGKTSVLQAIELLCRTFRRQSETIDQQYQLNRTYGVADEVELSCVAAETHYRYRSTLKDNSPTSSEANIRRGDLKHAPLSGVGATVAIEGPILDWKPWHQQHGVLPYPVWLRLDPNVLRDPSSPINNSRKTHSIDPRKMHSNGRGLHMATAAMNLEEPDLWLKLQDDLRTIVPAIRRLRHTPQNELLFDTINGTGLKALQVSEGTLLTLGLLTAIHTVNKPSILLLDDLDRALHPKAQRDLIDLLRGIQLTNPEIQIVASTHSPYMLGHMKPSEVRVTYLRDDGSTACEPLTNHPQFSRWKEEFHPGEMWSLFGEKWVSETEVTTK